jgi:hypothetical protein
MREADELLLHQARKLITATNADYAKRLIFCYQISRPDSKERDLYENLLRDFVASNKLDFSLPPEWEAGA